MKTITFIITLFIGLQSWAYSPEFTQAMEQALSEMQDAQQMNDLKTAANSFSRISSVSSEEWLPLYYEAHCYILMSFMEKDNTTKDAHLDIAENRINRILKMQPENDEAYALQSFMYTARLVVDPMSRGREYTIKSAEAYKKALTINPNNPRAQYLQLSNEVGTAQFFGKSTAEYCPRIQELYTNWDSLNEVPHLHPSWGKRQISGLAKGCNSNPEQVTN